MTPPRWHRVSQLTPKFATELANCRRQRPTRLWPLTAARRDGAQRVSRLHCCNENGVRVQQHRCRGARRRLQLHSSPGSTADGVRSLVDDVRADRRITGNPSTTLEELFQFLFLPLAAKNETAAVSVAPLTLIFLVIFTDKISKLLHDLA